MITFDNVLEKARQEICHWENKEKVSEVTFIRDIYGKISFLINDMEILTEEEKQAAEEQFRNGLQGYFGGSIYWKNVPSKIQRRIQPIIEMIEDQRRVWSEQDGINFYVLERPIAKKAWLRTGVQQESVWSYDEAVENNGTKVVTFYSFKGGMGRTTTLAGTALQLAAEGKNVMMVDADIEAPGLATLFFDDEVIARGVIDYLLEKELTPELLPEDYVLDVTDPALLGENDGRLYLMPAGKVDRNYLQKLARIDYQDNREGHLKQLLTTLLTDLKTIYTLDYILIDARAGFHDMGGVVLLQIPHGAVLFGNNSRQSWDGMTQILRAIAEGHASDFPVMLVNAMCPKPTDSSFAEEKRKFSRKAYSVCLENYYDSEHEFPGPEAEGEVHTPQFMPFQDELLRSVELYSDGSEERNQRVQAYKRVLTGDFNRKIVNRIKSWFGEDAGNGSSTEN